MSAGLGRRGGQDDPLALADDDTTWLLGSDRKQHRLGDRDPRRDRHDDLACGCDVEQAAVDIATLRDVEALPPGVADKILVAASVAPMRSAPAPVAIVVPPDPVSTTTDVPAPQPAPDELAEARTRKRSRAPMFAYAAAAAGVALAIGSVIWARAQEPKVITQVVERVVTPPPPRTPTSAEARAALLAEANDVVTLAWTPTKDAAAQGAAGDVVWSPSRQQGFMRFTGLAVNDPKRLQYQLWIFDKNRDQAFP
ncbi:MAG TPA: anti-sigma factor, partial [Kofleriaceae bacterium]|nr:anti-sigma factor [Kofleriaceae bacterium]